YGLRIFGRDGVIVGGQRVSSRSGRLPLDQGKHPPGKRLSPWPWSRSTEIIRGRCPRGRVESSCFVEIIALMLTANRPDPLGVRGTTPLGGDRRRGDRTNRCSGQVGGIWRVF